MTPDLWLLIAVFAVGVLFYVAYRTGSLAEERRRAQARPTIELRPLAPKPPRLEFDRARSPRPLTHDRLVQVDAGPHRGLCGWVRELGLDPDTGHQTAKLQLNDGTLLTVPRADVSPLFG